MRLNNNASKGAFLAPDPSNYLMGFELIIGGGYTRH
jgi:hypothetical protein